ncbi:hypothetical protein HETIRDRAFT_460500, partial [Heterobasidion irregulare TC 32-1]
YGFACADPAAADARRAQILQWEHLLDDDDSGRGGGATLPDDHLTAPLLAVLALIEAEGVLNTQLHLLTLKRRARARGPGPARGVCRALRARGRDDSVCGPAKDGEDGQGLFEPRSVSVLEHAREVPRAQPSARLTRPARRRCATGWAYRVAVWHAGYDGKS